MKRQQPVQAGRSAEPSVMAFMQAVASNMNALSGQTTTSEPLKELPSTATLAEVIAAVNVIIRRMS